MVNGYHADNLVVKQSFVLALTRVYEVVWVTDLYIFINGGFLQVYGHQNE